MANLTPGQILTLLVGAGPSITSNQAEQLEAALRSGEPLDADSLGLLFFPVPSFALLLFASRCADELRRAPWRDVLDAYRKRFYAGFYSESERRE